MMDRTWFKRKLKKAIIEQVHWDDLNAELEANKFQVSLMDTMQSNGKFVVRVKTHDEGSHYFEVIVKEMR